MGRANALVVHVLPLLVVVTRLVEVDTALSDADIGLDDLLADEFVRRDVSLHELLEGVDLRHELCCLLVQHLLGFLGVESVLLGEGLGVLEFVYESLSHG